MESASFLLDMRLDNHLVPLVQHLGTNWAVNCPQPPQDYLHDLCQVCRKCRPTSSDSASSTKNTSVGFRRTSKCSLHLLTVSLVQVSSSPTQLNTAWAKSCFPFLRWHKQTYWSVFVTKASSCLHHLPHLHPRILKPSRQRLNWRTTFESFMEAWIMDDVLLSYTK